METCKGLGPKEKKRAMQVEVLVERASDKNKHSRSTTPRAHPEEIKERTRQTKKLKTDDHTSETEKTRINAQKSTVATIAKQTVAATIAQQTEAATIAQQTEDGTFKPQTEGGTTKLQTEDATIAQQTELTTIAHHGQDISVAQHMQGKQKVDCCIVNPIIFRTFIFLSFLHWVLCQFQMMHQLFRWLTHLTFGCNLPLHPKCLPLQLICHRILQAFVCHSSPVLRR